MTKETVTRIICFCTLFIIAATASHAQELAKFLRQMELANHAARRAAILPPPEYECPYKGTLHIRRVPTAADVRIMCPHEVAPIGCTRRTVDHKQCFVLLLDDEAIKARGYEPNDVYRHEMAHCNGWKHENSRAESSCQRETASDGQ